MLFTLRAASPGTFGHSLVSFTKAALVRSQHRFTTDCRSVSLSVGHSILASSRSGTHDQISAVVQQQASIQLEVKWECRTCNILVAYVMLQAETCLNSSSKFGTYFQENTSHIRFECSSFNWIQEKVFCFEIQMKVLIFSCGKIAELLNI
jgi:hypothetical protein